MTRITSKLACVAAGIGIALVPQLVTQALPAGVTVLELRDEQAPYRRVVAITDARRQPSELTRMFIRLAKQAATPTQLDADNVHYVKPIIERPFPVAWRWSWEDPEAVSCPAEGCEVRALVATPSTSPHCESR
jgi:hypothetical protein